jgi:hypothetical protein
MLELEYKIALITCAARGNRPTIAGAFSNKDTDVILTDIDVIQIGYCAAAQRIRRAT